MFLIGEAKGKVSNGKLELPREYHLKKREILGKWKGEGVLYLSDSEKSLNFIAGRETLCFMARIDSEDRIEMPHEYENASVEIKGCISTVELTFHKQ
ncbi:MAG TPA: hypothetical protein VJZ06_02135 [Mobilitalea sp.]|nr:hypothetical protein [Mobilitalea sp.]